MSMDEPLGRMLTCTACGEPVDVIELPRPWIDPELYRCGECQKARRPQLRLVSLEDTMRSEQPAYDPQQAAIPF